MSTEVCTYTQYILLDRMETPQSVSVIYAKSLCDLVRFLNGTPEATGVRVEMGLRFWGSPSVIKSGIPDSDLDEDREDIIGAISDHPSLEVLVFRGPSYATFGDLAAILKGAINHTTFRSLMIPVTPPEWYNSPVEKSYQRRSVTSLVYKAKSLIQLHITNGTNNPGDYPDAYGEHIDSRMTNIFQRAITSLLRVKQYRKDREERQSRI